MGRIDNPGALAGATGTDFGIAFKTETYRNRAKAATTDRAAFLAHVQRGVAA